MMSVPPASPSLIGCGMPGNVIGIMPKMMPKAIPKKNGTRLGWERDSGLFPTSFATELMSSSVPTTCRTSPNCSSRLPFATSSIPALIILVTETLKLERIIRLFSFFPVRDCLVTLILLVIRCSSIFIQSD